MKHRLASAALALLAVGGAGAPLALAQTAATTAAPIPAREFFRAPQMASPVLSPDGKQLAMLMANDAGRLELGIVDVAPPRKFRAVAGYANGDVVRVAWVNNERLVYNVADLESAASTRYSTAMFAVNANGENKRQLVQAHWGRDQTSTMIQTRQLLPNHHLLRTLRDGSADVILERLNYDSDGKNVLDVTPLRLNTVNGTVASITTAYANGAREWLVDETGQARMLLAQQDGQARIQWRADATAPWTEVSSFDAYRGGAGAFGLVGVGPDGEIYVHAERKDADRTEALFRFDRDSRRVQAEPLVGVAGFDFQGRPLFDHARRKLLGVRYTGDARSTAWFDEDMQKLQARVDGLLPGLVNLIDAAECNCARWVLVSSYSDRQPPVYLLFDRESGKLDSLGPSRPAMDARRMGERDFLRIPARDGLPIPLHVTRPDNKVHGKGPWPAIVLLHGGPFQRGGSWEWDAESQFLASRGYLVIEPEFRGSTGYGQRLFRAGWRQWGRAMQDDVTDATRWAINEKLADASRICIAGASYGGYATLMGLIREPQLYRCGVAWAAVSDIQMMFDLNWSDLSEEWKRFGMKTLVGDPKTDAETFDANSPLKQAARLNQPLLLAHGGSDKRVPIEHGTRLRDALRKTNDKVEWVVYPEEGHGWFKPENRFDFYMRVEKFLARQLAPQ